MTRAHPWFLSVADVAGLVSQQGLPDTLAGLVRCLDEDFQRWPDFDKCPRVASHSTTGVIELMPISDGHLYSFKYVNGHPGNVRLGLSTVMAFGALAEVRTGLPLLISDLTLGTALRTAATSVLAARVLARPGSRVMALIGNGAQSEFQALAFHHLMGIHTVRLFDVDASATQRLVRHLAGTGLRVQVCASVAEAMAGADIVTTATADKRLATIVQAEWLRPGMHLNAIGGDCPGKTELAPAVLQASTVFVEFEPQSRIEGELQHMPPDFPCVELWRVLGGQHPGRQHDHEITVFDSVGFALEDFSTLRYLHTAALAHQLGRPWPLMPQLDDPRNLFGLLAGASQRERSEASLQVHAE